MNRLPGKGTCQGEGIVRRGGGWGGPVEGLFIYFKIYICLFGCAGSSCGMQDL